MLRTQTEPDVHVGVLHVGDDGLSYVFVSEGPVKLSHSDVRRLSRCMCDLDYVLSVGRERANKL